MRHWGGGGGRGGICAVDGHPSHPPLALKAHWGLQRLGLLGEGLPECLQPTRGPITEDFLSSSMAACRLGPPGICLLHDATPPTPAQGGLCPSDAPCARSFCFTGPRRSGQERSRECVLVWLVTNIPGLLPACPPCGPRGACGLFAPGLSVLCPAHPCTPASSASPLPWGLYSRAGRTGEEGQLRPIAGLPGSWWGAGSKGRE